MGNTPSREPSCPPDACEQHMADFLACASEHAFKQPEPYETEYCEELKDAYRTCRRETRALAEKANGADGDKSTCDDARSASATSAPVR